MGGSRPARGAPASRLVLAVFAIALTALGTASAGPLGGPAGVGGSGPAGGIDDCRRPYAAGSPWNLRIDRGRKADRASDAYVAWLARRGPLTSDPTQYTYPLYVAGRRTPQRLLRVDGFLSIVSDGGRHLRNVKRGSIRVPAPAGLEPARGDDAQVIVVEAGTGLEWGAYRFRRDRRGRLRAQNAYVYDTGWSGVPPESRRGSSFASRGAGVPYLAGLVRRCEIDRARIDHALAFAYDSPTPSFVPPATKSDGTFTDARGLPEGARLQLDPGLSTSELAGLGCTGPCLTIARALQRYGMFLIDGSGRSKLIVEYEGTARWDGLITAETVSPLPWAAFRVIRLGRQRVRADAGVAPAPSRLGRLRCTLVGTAAADVLVGTPGPDVICAGGGADAVHGGDGDDVIAAGSGADRVFAGDGDDMVSGGAGRDRLLGQAGDDELDARRGGRDRVVGGPGVDRARVDRGSDRVTSTERVRRGR